jgi:hypothetical protein
MTSALDITEAVNPPRAAFLDYPLGHTTGKPHQPALQREILLEALAGFDDLTAPGSVKMLPFRWSADLSWQETAQRGPDDRRPRYDTPQYQGEEDRDRASACGTPAGAISEALSRVVS